MYTAAISREFTFEAAHHLPNVPPGHKCRRLHGHSYRVAITVAGPVGVDTGWVRDFADLKSAWSPLDDRLDHRYLNEVPGLENPTSERLAIWIWDELVVGLPGLTEISVKETCTSECRYTGDGSRA